MLMNRLTVKEVQNSKTGKLSDGGGLYIYTDESNNRKWTFKYTSPSGKRREMGLGVFPDVSLADARSAASTARIKVKNGIDPIDQKYQEIKLIEQSNRQITLSKLTIEEASMAFFEKIKPTLKPTERGYMTWISPLRTHVFPKYGALRVHDVDSALLVKIFTPIWNLKPDTARKLFARMRKVLRANGVPNSVFEDVKVELPLRAPALQQHFKSMDWQKVPAFYEKISDFPQSPARLCLQLVILTAVRCAEARRAEHSHFSFENLTWTVPAPLVKGPLGVTVPHLVPMNDAVVSVVKTAMNWHGKWLFPSPSHRLCISDVAMTRIMRRMGHDETVHGFRSSFRDWAAENGEEFESAEAQLHHTIGSKVTRAYYRTNLLERRRAMMGRWASFVLGVEIDSNVFKFREKMRD